MKTSSMNQGNAQNFSLNKIYKHAKADRRAVLLCRAFIINVHLIKAAVV